MQDNHKESYGNLTERPEEIEGPIDVPGLRKELNETRQKLEDTMASWQRAQADFTNIRKRLEQDKADAIKYAEGDLLIKLLPILDDMERALKAVSPILKDDAWVQGIAGIARKFRSAMESVGLKEICALGFAFDPTMHEACAHLPGPEGMVIGEYEKGYQFKDRILRAPRVAVGSGEKVYEEEEE
jgi:molecular chaperone GrpE